MTSASFFFMLPLESSASTIETSCTASWNVSSVWASPSSMTSRSSFERSRYRPAGSVAVNSMRGLIGGGFGAK